MTREGLSSPFVPLGAPRRCDMDCIYHARVRFVQPNFCRLLNHPARFWGNALSNRAWGSQGRRKAPAEAFLAVSLERVQHTCAAQAGGESDARPVVTSEGSAGWVQTHDSSQRGWQGDGGVLTSF